MHKGVVSHNTCSLDKFRILLTLPKWPILDPSNFKDFAGDNFKFDKNSRMFSKWIENAVGKGEIAPYEHFLLFPQCFQKTLTADM